MSNPKIATCELVVKRRYQTQAPQHVAKKLLDNLIDTYAPTIGRMLRDDAARKGGETPTG